MRDWVKRVAFWLTHEDVWAINKTHGGQVLRAYLGTKKREWVVTLIAHPILIPFVVGAVIWLLHSVIDLDGPMIQRSGAATALLGALMQYVVVGRRRAEVFSEVYSSVERAFDERMFTIATIVRDRPAREVGSVYVPTSGLAENVKKYEAERLSFLGSVEFVLVIAGSFAAIFGDWISTFVNCRISTC